MLEPKLASQNHLPALTGIRAIAAFMVFAHHFNPFYGTSLPKRFVGFFDELHIGVTLFFVLSGFLIAYRYYDKQPFNFKVYMINRFARIYPMYFILTSLTFIYLFFQVDADLSTEIKMYFFNISLLKALFDDLKFSGITQGWTLTVEEMFYFTAPLFFLLIKRSKLFLAITPLLLFCTGSAIVFTLSHMFPYGFFKSLSFMTYHTYFGRALEFFTGISLALLFKTYGTTFKTKYCTLVGGIVIFLCVVALNELKGGNDLGIRSRPGMLVNNVILPVFGICVFYWGIITEKTIVQRFLSSNLLVLLGKSSYIFYLIHMGVLCSFLREVTTNFVFLFVLLNLISIFLYKFVEDPLNSFIRSRLMNRYVKNPASNAAGSVTQIKRGRWKKTSIEMSEN